MSARTNVCAINDFYCTFRIDFRRRSRYKLGRFNFNPSHLLAFFLSLSRHLDTECKESQADEKDVHEKGTLNVIEDQCLIGRIRSRLVESLLGGSAMKQQEDRV